VRALLTIAIFVAAAVGGGAYWSYSSQPSAVLQSRFQALETMPEPPVGAELRGALERRDMSSLAVLLTTEQQQQLSDALGPVTSITEIRLLGAVQTGHDTVVGYLVRGLDSQGSETVAGLVLNLKDNLLESLQ
jgi:hypothetical protein